MRKWERVRNYALGNPIEFKMEEILVITITFVAMLMAIFATTCNIIIGLGPSLIIMTSFSSIWFGLLYYAARINRWYLLTKIITVVSVVGLLDLIWLNNAGSFGPMPLVLVMVFSVFLFLWDGWKRIIFIIVYILNLSVQFLIENFYPHIIKSYLNPNDRIYDFYSGFIINICLSAVLIISIKRIYILEKNKAIESEKIKTAFLANMSHEIRTPMNGIIGFAELLNEPNLGEEKRKKYSKIIFDSSQKLMVLINDVLDLSKLESNKVVVSRDFINVDIFCQKLFQFYELKINEKGLKFSFSNLIAQKDFMLYTDEQKLWQVLNNILNNALKFTCAGSIDFKCSILRNEVVFSISDTGVGIDKQYHSLLFERFSQIEHTLTAQVKGSGLGLFISKNLISLLGGRIWLESEINLGSTFFVSIPASN